MHNKANLIVEVAKDLVGIRYRHQGRTRLGLDCAGLIICVAHLCMISSFDTTAYAARPNANEFTREMIMAGCKQLPMTELAHGDILRINSHGWPVHIGIYEVDQQGQEWYIHAFLPHKMVSRDPVSPEVRVRISSVWRYPE